VTAATPRSDYLEFIREISLFASLPESALEEIAARVQERDVPAGDWVFREGEAGEGLYVLRTGRLEVVREAGDAEIMIRTLSPGAVLGELAVLTDAPRSASVRARRDSNLLGLSNSSFLELVEDADFALALTTALAIQLQASRAVTLPSDPVPPVIALVPLDESDASAAFAADLASALSRWTAAKHLVEREAAEAASFGDALDRWERAAGQVLLTVDSSSSGEWRAFCMRQADRLVAVAGNATRGPTIAGGLQGADLVMLGWPSSRGALETLIPTLQPRTVYPIGGEERRPAAIDIVARRLSGRAPGVVLSGGGARGFAHIGVLDELLEAGLDLDRVGGCSMGALVGALFATGLAPDEIEARLHAELVERNPMSDYTVPLAALVRGRKAEAMLLRLFGDRQIEELEREFFCVSSDLVTSELVVHRRGNLYEAVGASLCLPGVGPPVAVGERLLVDGGVLDNLPVATMAARGEGPVIAVDVSSRFEPPSRTTAGTGRPRLRRLSTRVRRAIVGWDTALPSFGETLTRSVVLGSIDTAEAARKHADVVIAPAVQGIGLVEFDRIEEIREQGSAAARDALAKLPESVFESIAGAT
jgi:predicted acylesterase/phospholipase RssA/CRP-like cAMP-binding protein